MDITAALAPKSDQLDAVELVSPRTFTIDTGSRLGTREGQTVAEIRLVDFPRVWRPSKGMLDVLARLWSQDGSAWVGRSVTLYNDPEVTFGKEKVGGIRISHMSDIGDKPVTVLTRGRGRGARTIPWKVEPLTVASTPQQQTGPDLTALTDAFKAAGVAQSKWLAYSSQVVGRELTSANDLTQTEAGRVIDALNQDAAESEGQS